MEHISKLANQALQNEQQQPEKNGREITDKTIINLWERMNHIYGHKFGSTYGESAIKGNALSEAARTWSVGLRDLTGEQIAKGLHECISSGEAWPPALPEFVKMCKGKSVNDFGLDYIPECYRETKRERLLESDENKAKHKAAYESGMKGLKNTLKKS